MSSCCKAAIVALLLGARVLSAQAPGAQAAKAEKPDKAPKAIKVPVLFTSEAPLDITFTANFRQLRKDTQDGAPYRWAQIAYRDSAGRAVTVPARTRTRGVWRLANCDFPPLRLNFASKTSKGTLFGDLDEPKLVNYCLGGPEAERFVLQEYLLNRVYRVLTPASHQVRLLRVTYVDSASGKPELTRYAFLADDPQRMAERLGGRLLKTEGAGADDLDAQQAATLFLFEYLIGNTDFSIAKLHNVELVSTPSGRALPVPYDFDFAGAIDPPYARPAPGLRITRVRDRQFRGYCSIKDAYLAVLPHFVAQRAAINALYDDAVGQLLDRKTARETRAYFDEFYRQIATPRDFERNLYAECSDRR